MNFQEAEKTYQDLRGQYSAGKVTSTDFEAAVSKLKVQDADGRWWQIGVQSGDWYVHDGQKWSKSRPPTLVAAAPAPAQPSPPPEEESIPAATRKGPPMPTLKPARPSRVAPRLFSAIPAGREGGLPTPVLAGVAGVVALLGIGAIIVGFLYLSGQWGGAGTGTGTPVARATTTPTTIALVVASPVLPTLPPPLPTNTPVPLPPTVPIAIVPTAVVTPTVSATATGGAPRPTATTRPAASPTAAQAKATATSALPPGVYVTNLRTDAVALPGGGQQITFHVTFSNTTSNLGPNPWIVKIFKCVAACTAEELADNKSIGETPRVTQNILPGNKELSAGPWTVGLGACNLIASPYYIDGQGNVVPFPVPGGNRLYHSFNPCP